MKFFSKVKDGGPESKVHAYFLAEVKSLFSIALLRFDRGSREAFHTHAFDCISWVLKGKLSEELKKEGPRFRLYPPSLLPVITRRETFHKVKGLADRTWVLTFRGPWAKTWKEYLPNEARSVTLTHGRKDITAHNN